MRGKNSRISKSEKRRKLGTVAVNLFANVNAKSNK